MNIAVIAANGRTGREFVKLALEKGHSVRAGIHRSSLDIDHPNLVQIKYTVDDETQLEKLLYGSDAVACFIGHQKNSPKNLQTDAIKAIIETCQRLGIRRLISLTGTGVRFEGDTIPMIDKIMNFSIEHIDPNRVNDGRSHAEILKQSSLEWTLIRVLKLTNGKPKPYRLSTSGPAKTFVARSEVAKVCLEILENNNFIKQAPIISKV